jgi:crotonobetainyl-CoA:carnitine CoA-transferase CaiB-like acyl-CoA transferase
MKLLEGVCVLDLTNVLAGPFATLHLALLGADVIKIENPDGGDLARKLGNVSEYNRKLLGTSFLAQNANKRSLTLNLKSEEGKEIFRRLLEKADVVVENFRPGVLERLGFSYDQMRKINPRVIYCAITGFGQTGPDASKPAYDQIIQGLSGLMSINGDERLNPLRCGFPVCDTVGGLNAVFAIMAALYHRERTGEGQFIDIALLDSIMPLMGWVAANLLIGGQQPIPIGNENFTAAPSSMFRTKNGFINIAANQQQQWEDLADALAVPEFKNDPRFQERDTRKANRYVLGPLLESRLMQETTEHWVAVLNARGIPAGDVVSLEAALTSAQARHRQVIAEVEEPELGTIKIFNLTAKFSETPGSIESPPPRLSEHTEAILSELGYSAAERQELSKKSVI